MKITFEFNRKRSTGDFTETDLTEKKPRFFNWFKNEPIWVRSVAVLFILFYAFVFSIMVIRIVRAIKDSSGVEDFFLYSGWNEWGDSFGGLFGPLVGFIGAVLVYKSFKEQIKANQDTLASIKATNDARLEDERFRKEERIASTLKENMLKIESKMSSFDQTTRIHGSFDELLDKMRPLVKRSVDPHEGKPLVPYVHDFRELLVMSTLANYFGESLLSLLDDSPSKETKRLVEMYIVEFRTFIIIRFKMLVAKTLAIKVFAIDGDLPTIFSQLEENEKLMTRQLSKFEGIKVSSVKI